MFPSPETNLQVKRGHILLNIKSSFNSTAQQYR